MGRNRSYAREIYYVHYTGSPVGDYTVPMRLYSDTIENEELPNIVKTIEPNTGKWSINHYYKLSNIILSADQNHIYYDYQ